MSSILSEELSHCEIMSSSSNIIPDSVIIISNWTEESLKAKLKTFKGYEENMLEFENRFLRRFTEYKANNEGDDEQNKSGNQGNSKKKKPKDKKDKKTCQIF